MSLIEDIRILKLQNSTDERGMFCKIVPNEYVGQSSFKICELFYSSSRKDVIRGMHFQKPPNAQAKLVTVIKGRILDVILDLRKNSKSYGNFVSFDLKEGDGKAILIPKGFAHGFLGKDSENVVLYITDSKYSREAEDGLRYDSFGFNWEISNPIISRRDAAFSKYEDFISPFN